MQNFATLWRYILAILGRIILKLGKLTDFEALFPAVSIERTEKSLHHVSMVAKFMDDNKPKKSLKSLFALFQTSPILFDFI